MIAGSLLLVAISVVAKFPRSPQVGMLMNSYAMLNDYVRQVLFLTSAVVLLAPSDGTSLIAAERAIATLIGTLLAGALALLLERAEAEPAAVAQAAQGQ